MTTREYPTLTALMAGREPGSVKVRHPEWAPQVMFRPGAVHKGTKVWDGLNEHGFPTRYYDESGPWLLVAEDQPLATTNTVDFRGVQFGNAVLLKPAPPAPSQTDRDVVRLQMAATILAGLYANQKPIETEDTWARHALAEADALLAEAEANPREKK